MPSHTKQCDTAAEPLKWSHGQTTAPIALRAGVRKMGPWSGNTLSSSAARAAAASAAAAAAAVRAPSVLCAMRGRAGD